MRRDLFILPLLWLLVACGRKIPERWASLGMPTQDLEQVREETSDHRFSADYRGCTEGQLMARVEGALVAVGYKPACSQFEGRVRGYARKSEKLLVKVDLMGPMLALTVADERGADRLLYGICFEGYELGEPERLK